jgi:predicted transcriptional regulator
MTIETYEELAGKNKLYTLIQEGIDDIENGNTITEEEIVKNIDKALGVYKKNFLPESRISKKSEFYL